MYWRSVNLVTCLLYLILTHVPVQSVTQTGCPDGTVAFEGSCFYFGHGQVSYTEAKVYCSHRGGHLVHISDGIENAFLKDKLRQHKDQSWWLGIVHEFGLYHWSNDDQLVRHFTDWRFGRPDGSGSCVIFSVDDNFAWKVVDCSGLYTPLCQIPGHGSI